MSRVIMLHPDLPEQPIEVDERAVAHYQSSGWEIDTRPPLTQPTPKTAARRRRQQQQQGDES
ncbi:hypothetical protein BX257_4736 [Streptomyces sp. 3212.3]|uniref:hypothetical protein n=1 Tax=Streptomyces sp. 3212.3 TaxID=1938846 RepID=UPI000E24F7A0|nr:hypothetical protein [Streptomyces sp. 3212.3]REE62123.1 hypothetical protein BX257_4736 [Streptomyces sp. 3212.3]